MSLSEYDFELPEELIAQEPPKERGASRLLAVNRSSGAFSHLRFVELPGLLREGDVLVLNDARVIPARLLGKKADTGGKVELLLVRPWGDTRPGDSLSATTESVEWMCLGQASKGLRPGAKLDLEGGLEAEVVEATGGGEYRVRLWSRGAPLATLLEKAGRLPLPPYIVRPPTAADAERYQTVYAQAPGSVAAPTAGLHFTPELLGALEAKGIERATVTLDVGPGTFLPVRSDNVDEHVMHSERYVVPARTVEVLGRARAEGRRVIAVGTTVVRTLEAATDDTSGRLREGEGETRLFIRPGFRFRQVDAMLTNFHLPRSTLLMLVSAFLGRERLLDAYREAVKTRYRFFSYGDAMFLA